jgi:V-type H+-transporting ATPase subunit a
VSFFKKEIKIKTNNIFSELPGVLWRMVLNKGLICEAWVGGIVLYIIFAVWATLTMSILILMEGL